MRFLRSLRICWTAAVFLCSVWPATAARDFGNGYPARDDHDRAPENRASKPQKLSGHYYPKRTPSHQHHTMSTMMKAKSPKAGHSMNLGKHHHVHQRQHNNQRHFQPSPHHSIPPRLPIYGKYHPSTMKTKHSKSMKGGGKKSTMMRSSKMKSNKHDHHYHHQQHMRTKGKSAFVAVVNKVNGKGVFNMKHKTTIVTKGKGKGKGKGRQETPSSVPSVSPTTSPLAFPSSVPSWASGIPTALSEIPSLSALPSVVPSSSSVPSEFPSQSAMPSTTPSSMPSNMPSIPQVLATPAPVAPQAPVTAPASPPVPGTPAPVQQAPLKEPSVGEAKKSANFPTISPSQSAFPSTSAFPSVSLWPTASLWPTGSFWPTASAWPSGSEFPSGLPRTSAVARSGGVLVVDTGKDRTIANANVRSRTGTNRAVDYPFLFVEESHRNGKRVRRQIVQILDLSRLRKNWVIKSATMSISGTSTNPGEVITVNMHRMLVPWQVSTVDGEFFGNGVGSVNREGMIQANGNEAKETPSASFLGRNQLRSVLDVTEDIQYWATNPSENFGWAFLAQEGDEGKWGMWRLDTSFGPKVTIEYSLD